MSAILTDQVDQIRVCPEGQVEDGKVVCDVPMEDEHDPTLGEEAVERLGDVAEDWDEDGNVGEQDGDVFERLYDIRTNDMRDTSQSVRVVCVDYTDEMR